MIRSLFDFCSIDRMLFSIERTPQSIETQKLNFLLNFSGDFGNVEEVSSLANGFMKYFNFLYVSFDEK